MRWCWWLALGLVLLLALWVGAFAAVFDLGPDSLTHRDRGTGRNRNYPVMREWVMRERKIGWVLLPIWRPLIGVWATCWGIPDPNRP